MKCYMCSKAAIVEINRTRYCRKHAAYGRFHGKTIEPKKRKIDNERGLFLLSGGACEV